MNFMTDIAPTNMEVLRNVNFLNLVQMGSIEAIKRIIWTLPFPNVPLNWISQYI